LTGNDLNLSLPFPSPVGSVCAQGDVYTPC
jgi:hypothetical protein